MNIVSKILGIINGTNPANPTSGKRVLFAKSDGWYDKNSSGTVTKLATTSDISTPYLVYTASLTQSSTSAPVATVLENTLGGTVVWDYNSVGVYTATLSGVFTIGKTNIIYDPFHNMGGDALITSRRQSANEIRVISYQNGWDGIYPATANDILENFIIEIRVYP